MQHRLKKYLLMVIINHRININMVVASIIIYVNKFLISLQLDFMHVIWPDLISFSFLDRNLFPYSPNLLDIKNFALWYKFSFLSFYKFLIILFINSSPFSVKKIYFCVYVDHRKKINMCTIQYVHSNQCSHFLINSVEGKTKEPKW